MKPMPGGFTAPIGFSAAGRSAGIKKTHQPDLALLFSEAPFAAAGVFTTNRIWAAPLRVTEEALRRGRVRAVICNSGNANACTGARGLRDARRMADAAARALGISSREVAVASTGVIGLPLPIDEIVGAIPVLARSLSARGSLGAARAIMTTDTVPKEAAVAARIGGKEVTVGGIAKGSGMIHPNMATMLAFLSTDARVTPVILRRILKQAVGRTFNRITVDGDRSTNDMALILANGLAKNGTIDGGRQAAALAEMIEEICKRLALMIVRDAEGTTKFIEITVSGARTPTEAERAAFAVATSPLVKTACFGQDPNWGRIMAALGNAEISLREERIGISIGDAPVVRSGTGLGPDADAKAARQMRKRDIVLDIRLGSGKAQATVWTSDLSTDYVKINAAYRS